MNETPWALVVRCVVCSEEAVFEAVVRSLAADKAERAGWSLDREALAAPVGERYATCPTHSAN